MIAVVADARKATIYRYLYGELDRVDAVRASHPVDHPEHMGTPRGSASTRMGASTLRDTRDDQRIAEILEMAGAQGLGVAGPTDAQDALDARSVRDLYVTQRA